MINRGIAPVYLEEGDISVLNQKCIRGHRIDYSLARRHDSTKKSVSDQRKLQYGDIVINSTGTGTLGRIAQVDTMLSSPVTVDSHVTIVRSIQDFFFAPFLNYAFMLIEPELQAAGDGCGGQTELSRKKVAEYFSISYPTSKQEQQRIAAILDAAFADIAKAKANAEKNLANIKEVFDSELNIIFVNKRFSWRRTILGEICDVMTGPFGSLLHKSDYVCSGFPVINPTDMKNGVISTESIKYVSLETQKRLKNYLVKDGDIVIARRGDVGRCAVVREDQVGWICGTGSFIARPHTQIESRFIAAYLGSQLCRKMLNVVATGATMLNLSNTSLQALPISMPSQREQQNIVARLDELAAHCKKLENLYTQKIALYDELKQSLLRKAFSGEL